MGSIAEVIRELFKDAENTEDEYMFEKPIIISGINNAILLV